MRRRQHPGGMPKLNVQQREQIPELLTRGPAAFGFSGEVWTRGRVAQAIEQEFGVSYDPSQVGRILRGCGWSRQKPALRSTQRDEDAIQDWRDRRFTELKKTPWPKAGPSPHQVRGRLCGPTNRGFTCCQRCCAPGRRWSKPR